MLLFRCFQVLSQRYILSLKVLENDVILHFLVELVIPQASELNER